jgi:hypothetical protein
MMTETSEKVQSQEPIRRRPPDIVLPVGQPLPKPPGPEWWFRRIIENNK